MKQLEVGDPREDHLCTAKDDEGTALDSRAKLKWWSPIRSSILVVVCFTATICGRSGRADQGPRLVHKGMAHRRAFFLARNLEQLTGALSSSLCRNATARWHHCKQIFLC
jgi:hypothetical protein